MKKQKATTAIILETRNQKLDDTYPVKLRVTFQRKQKYYATGKSFDAIDFEKINAERPRGDLKDAKIYLTDIEKKAIEIIDELPEFSFQAFDKRFNSKPENKGNIWTDFAETIERLKTDGRIGTAISYNNSLQSLKLFKTKTFVGYPEITVDFLKGYEKWMLNEGNSLTTIGIYLRNLRTLYNDAINAGIVKRELYPFHNRGYQIPSSRNVKKALTIDDVDKLFHYKAVNGTSEHFAKDLWLFSYLSNGMNIKDIALLKYKNIDHDSLIFVRSKTERTKRTDTKPIVVILTEDSKSIIEKWGNKPEHPESYIFPILSEGLTPTQERAKIQQATKTLNKYINRIAKALSIEKHVTSYTARHSFSTVLKRSGAPIEFISESLGHKDLRTTENYLDSFEDSVKKDWAGKLTAWNKPVKSQES